MLLQADQMHKNDIYFTHNGSSFFFSAWDKSHVIWDNFRNSTQKMRTFDVTERRWLRNIFPLIQVLLKSADLLSSCVNFFNGVSFIVQWMLDNIWVFLVFWRVIHTATATHTSYVERYSENFDPIFFPKVLI